MDSRRPEPERPDATLSEDLGYRFRPLPIALVLLAALIVAFLPLPGLSEPAHRTLVILVAAGGLWMTESLPVAVTALLIPVLALTLGVTDARGA
jgi:sodium-dependent dicarboxylate transporter 2/3/5